MNKVALVAIGGNSISPLGEPGDIPNQYKNIHETCVHLVSFIKEGYELVITHGNGPQVGNALLRVELAAPQVYPLPLDVCVADTEGGMGYMIQQEMRNALVVNNIKKDVVTIITQTEVDPNDSAFYNPTKPIGPFYSKKSAEEYKELMGWHIMEDAGRGYRRVVPSPRPSSILEGDLIKTLVEQGAIIIAAGGGGIPVVRLEGGTIKGIEAVVDKDLASSLLASQVGAKLFLISTGVEQVAINYRTPDQKNLTSLTVWEAKKYLSDGQFPNGSMGPKIKAAINFLEMTSNALQSPCEVIITSPQKIKDALLGKTGTRIIL